MANKSRRGRTDSNTDLALRVQFHSRGSFATEWRRYRTFQPMAIVLMRIDHTFRASCKLCYLTVDVFFNWQRASPARKKLPRWALHNLNTPLCRGIYPCQPITFPRSHWQNSRRKSSIAANKSERQLQKRDCVPTV